MRRAEGGANNFGVFRVKKHDFTPKNHILSNCGGMREKFWGISCENHDFTPKNLIFSNFKAPPTPPPPPPWIRPWLCTYHYLNKATTTIISTSNIFINNNHRRSWHGLTTTPFSNFLFTNLFSIKFLYFFIISSLFPYFNLFVSIFIQSYANNNLHVLTLYRYDFSLKNSFPIVLSGEV